MRWRDWAGLAILAALAGPVVRGQTAAAPALRDTHENLHGVLWMQTAAEYQAITRGLYRLAAVQLDRALQEPRWTAIPEQAGRADLAAPEAGRHPRCRRDRPRQLARRGSAGARPRGLRA